MNITQHISDDRQLVKEISQIECVIIEAMCHDANWLTPNEESVLRWALSLARVSKVRVAESSGAADVVIGHATDRYRESLFNTLEPFISHDGVINKKEIARFIKPIGALCADERLDLLQLYADRLPPESLDAAVRSRPLALSLAGGGGTAYVYLGAFEALQRGGIIPGAISGTSMGAIMGAYRARDREFSVERLEDLLTPVTFDKIARPFKVYSRFTVPGTFKLQLHEVFGKYFAHNGKSPRLSDLKIPFRVSVGGIAHIKGEKDKDVAEFAHLLDNSSESLLSLRRNARGIISKLLEMTKWPLKAIYLGEDEMSKEFDVLDAIGFSSAVPGIFHYDLLPCDLRMQKIVESLMEIHGVYRLLDGGWVDNLPSQAALDAVQSEKGIGNDPFVLALNGFAPNLQRHWLFMPVMQVAAQNSRRGREVAHRTISFKNVLSPLNIVPSKKDLFHAIKHGMKETVPHLAFVHKMLGPIPDPPFLKKRD